MTKKTVWEKTNGEERKKLFAFAEDYRRFLSVSKTERTLTANSIRMAEEAGFVPADSLKGAPKPGDRIYFVNRGKNICLYVIGKKPLTEGMNILGAHIDSPRSDLKQVPLYEKDGLALLDTHYYGGIKKYQWVARPMAMIGVVCLKDGSVIDINIGDHEGDPVVAYSDLLIHLAAEQMKKSGSEVVEGEQLDLLVGSIPAEGEEKEPVKKYILNLLKEKYGMEEDDFLSAEIEVVPAGEARNYGLDSSMIMGYGQDDKICAYASLRAILEMEVPERTSCCILVDKEEIGSVGNTGMQSRFFENTLIRLLDLCGQGSLRQVNEALTNSRMLSSDVSAAFDPLYPSVMDPKNAAFLGRGICFNKYTGARGKSGSSDASAEYVAKIRRVMDDNDVMFQTCEIGKVDAGGGGTIAYILADMNMDVIDAGICVLNMHAPYEISSKADLYEGWKAYTAFLKDMD